MAQLLPFRSDPDADQPPRLVNIDDEETADEVFAALSSETARNILSELYEEPTTASEVAESVDTSLQNARYHLDKLQAAGLVTEVDTWYSSRGTEMTVYAPTNDPLVVTAGGREHAAVLRNAVKRLMGAIGILGLASLLINRVARDFGPTTEQPVSADTGGADGAAGRVATENVSATPTEEAEMMDAAGAGDAAANATATPTPTATPQPTQTQVQTTTLKEATETVTPAAFRDGAAATDSGLLASIVTEIPPGGLFFAGGLLILLVGSAWWYFTRYRYGLA